MAGDPPRLMEERGREHAPSSRSLSSPASMVRVMNRPQGESSSTTWASASSSSSERSSSEPKQRSPRRGRAHARSSTDGGSMGERSYSAEDQVE